MYIDRYAHLLLFSNTLEAKLAPPVDIVDRKYPPLLDIPKQPGRPQSLLFDKGRASFPKPQEFHLEKKRGEALLFFANHELLAIELMALFILRFPQAPWKLRRGIVQILHEEQQHLQLYLQRASALGAQVGDVPVNRFFWDSLVHMKDPTEFLSAMSLTFEQANLDHCRYFASLFRKVDDHKSAEIMERIYLDEIRHVRHGHAWSKKYSSLPLWDFHVQNLIPPLTPARAKGKTFDYQGRQECGLPDDYIQKLRLYNSSKGRVPELFMFNSTIEHELYNHGKLPKITQSINSALSILFSACMKRDDILLVKALPSKESLAQLARLGISIPELCTNIDSLKHRRLSRIQTWGKSPQYTKEWSDLDYQHYTKSYGAKRLKSFLDTTKSPLLCPAESVGHVCTSLMEIESALQKIKGRAIIKADLGASGRGAIRYFGRWEKGQQAWLNRTLIHQGRCVVEPFHDRVMDFSMQIWMDKKGSWQIKGPFRFFTTPQGQYIGHWFGAFHAGLPKDLMPYLHKHGWKDLLTNCCNFVAARLHREGHVGPVGIDALIYKEGDRYLLRPIVEINPRYTMGHIAFQFAKRCKKPCIFSLARTSLIPVDTPTIKDGLCTRGHLVLNDPTAPFKAFLTVSKAHTESWLQANNISWHE